MRAGKLIAICGIDGSGKSTLAKGITANLKEAGIAAEVVKTIDSQGAFFDAYSRFLEAQTVPDMGLLSALLAFERVRNAVRIVEPALATGTTCVCDRYLLTERAYSVARGVETAGGHWNTLCSIVPVPDLTIIVDVPSDVAMARVRRRGKAIYSFQEREDLLAAVRSEYLNLVSDAFCGRTLVVDGRAPAEDCLQAAMTEVQSLYQHETAFAMSAR